MTRLDMKKSCARCDAEFVCEPEGDCWCKHLPPILPVPGAGAACLCRDCLIMDGNRECNSGKIRERA